MAIDINALPIREPLETLINPKRDYSERRPVSDREWHSQSVGVFSKQLPSSGGRFTSISGGLEDEQKSTAWTNSRTSNTSKVEDTLTITWGRQMLKFLDTDDSRWIEYSVDKSERYLLALFDNTESRNFISSYLMIMRTGNQRLNENPNVKIQFKRFLNDYLKSGRNASDRMTFLRASRSIGLSPSSAL